MQSPPARIEVALLGIEPALLVTIGPLALAVPRIGVAVGGRRLATQGSTDPLHNISSGLRMRRSRAERNNRTNGQYSKPNHRSPPLPVGSTALSTHRRGHPFLRLFYRL